MKAIIFTEGGKDIGFGHITRCCSLYDEIESCGINVEFVIYGDQSVKDILGNRRVLFNQWIIEESINNIDIDKCYCIVDSYKAQKNIYLNISKRCKRLLSIDDYNKINYISGIVVNPSIYTEEHNYPQNSNIKYLLGKDYIILRQPFLDSCDKNINKDTKQILIIMGGSDIRSLIPKIIPLLELCYPNAMKNVVLGYKNHYEAYENNKNIRIHYNIDALKIKKLMLESDIAITAAGQTVYELIKTGTPFIPIQVIDNQIYTVRGLLKYELVDKVIYWNSNDFETELIESLNSISSFESRREIYGRYLGCIDGLGAKRIVSELIRM